MNNNNIINIIWDIPFKLVAFARTARDFMFRELTIGNITISVWGIVGGVGVLALILYSIIKN